MEEGYNKSKIGLSTCFKSKMAPTLRSKIAKVTLKQYQIH